MVRFDETEVGRRAAEKKARASRVARAQSHEGVFVRLSSPSFNVSLFSLRAARRCARRPPRARRTAQLRAMKPDCARCCDASAGAGLHGATELSPARSSGAGSANSSGATTASGSGASASATVGNDARPSSSPEERPAMTAEGEEGGRARRETERRVTSATSLLLPTPGDAPPPVGFRARARALAYKWRGSLLRSSR